MRSDSTSGNFVYVRDTKYWDNFQFFDLVKFQSGSGSVYDLVIDFCIVMFYMLMILMKFSFVPQTFVGIFF